MTVTQLNFIDTLYCPLPAAIQYFIDYGSTNVASGFLGVAGTATVSLSGNTNYTASFIGTNAPSPTNITAFTTGAVSGLTVQIQNYCSPIGSLKGYAIRQTKNWPNGWFSDAAKTTGGVAYAFALGVGAELYDLSVQIQDIWLASRLQSSAGQQIDSWAADFFGVTLPRYAAESDQSYISRIIAALSAKQSTLSGLSTIAGFWGTNVSIEEPWNPYNTGAYDTPGTLAYDYYGGLGTQAPYIFMFIVPNAGVNLAQMKAAITSARGCGIPMSIINVTQVSIDEYLGYDTQGSYDAIGGFDEAGGTYSQYYGQQL